MLFQLRGSLWVCPYETASRCLRMVRYRKIDNLKKTDIMRTI